MNKEEVKNIVKNSRIIYIKNALGKVTKSMYMPEYFAWYTNGYEDASSELMIDYIMNHELISYE